MWHPFKNAFRLYKEIRLFDKVLVDVQKTIADLKAGAKLPALIGDAGLLISDAAEVYETLNLSAPPAVKGCGPCTATSHPILAGAFAELQTILADAAANPIAAPLIQAGMQALLAALGL